jgi:hypothetical protein
MEPGVDRRTQTGLAPSQITTERTEAVKLRDDLSPQCRPSGELQIPSVN